MKTWTSVLLLLLLVGGCSATGAETTQTFEFEYPDTEPAPVILDIRSGVLNLIPVAGNSVKGRVTTNVKNWSVSQTVDADGAQRVTQGETRNEVIPNASNIWDVEMGTGQPLALTVNSEAADASLELGGLPLQALTINGNSGDCSLDYASPNPLEDGGRARIQLASGKVTLKGVFNSHVSDLTVITTSGNPTVEFGGGTLVQDLETTIETTVGDVVLRIPMGTAARVMFTGASGRVMEVSSEFAETSNNVFETPEYSAGSLPRVQIAVHTVAGDLHLTAVPPL